MKNGIWHPADFEGKNAGEEKTKEKTAVAIAYEPVERSPKILATGKGYLADKIIENNYHKYSSLNYLYNNFENNVPIYPIHRRIYRVYVKNCKIIENPFKISSAFYKLLCNENLIYKGGNSSAKSYDENEKKKGKGIEIKLIQPILRIALKIIGVKKYSMLVRFSELLGRKEYHYFLINRKRK